MTSVMQLDLTDMELETATGGQWLVRPPQDVPARVFLGVSTDSREVVNGRVFFAIPGQRMDGHEFVQQAADAGAATLVVERDVTVAGLGSRSPGILKVQSSRRALSDLAQFYRSKLARLKVIAITGSAGKTTTKRMVNAVLSQRLVGTASPKSFNNDLGVPITLLGARPADHYVVAEIGMNRPGEVAALGRVAQPDVAVITMVGRAHLEGLGSLEAIAEEKWSLVHTLRPGGTAIVNADHDLLVCRAQAGLACSVIMFGESQCASIRLVRRTSLGSSQIIHVDVDGRQTCFDLHLPGRHNAVNALAAIAVGRVMGLSENEIQAGLASVKPEAMRMTMQVVAGVHICNDAYNANPESMKAGLQTFIEMTAGSRERRIAVLGDMLELGSCAADIHEEVGDCVAELCQQGALDVVVTVGSYALHIARRVEQATTAASILTFSTAEDVMNCFSTVVHPGDSVYLKASRGVGLERVLRGLETSCSTT